ncbi:hypothetical protein GW17_00000204, partial [Ensete ventricosum]
ESPNYNRNFSGYDGSMAEWEDYPRYVNSDGVEVPPPVRFVDSTCSFPNFLQGVYGDMYHHGYGYAPYGPYPSPGSPVPTLGHNGQLYGPQHYQFPATYYQPPTATSAPDTTSQIPSSKREVSTSTAASLPSIPVDTTKSDSNETVKASTNGNNGSLKLKPSQQNSSLNSNGSLGKGAFPGGHPSSGYQDPRFGFDGMWSPVPWYDSLMFPDGQQRPTTANTVSSTRNQNLRPLPHLMVRGSKLRGMHAPRTAGAGMVNKMYPNHRMYGQHANGFRSGQSFYSSMYDSRMNGRWGMSVDSKYKPRGRSNGFYGYGNENLDGLSELNKGPRSGRFRNQKGFGPTITLAVRGQSLPANVNIQDSAVIPERDQYNKSDFPETYSEAKFFIIKSYSEDDIHKSIKYNVWASTPHGNKKLDAAYQESKEKTSGCPVFLFFSVNTSGQFVGVAEMVGPVDFNKTLDYWQQDKWVGYFPVKWHIVKDVPNNILKHITLENNDNKPVTNSRDTQEVRKLFTFMDGKPVEFGEKDKDASNGKPGSQKPLEVVTVLKKESAQVGLALGEHVLSEKNGLAAVAGVAPKDAKPVTEKWVVANGVANCC